MIKIIRVGFSTVTHKSYGVKCKK